MISGSVIIKHFSRNDLKRIALVNGNVNKGHSNASEHLLNGLPEDVYEDVFGSKCVAERNSDNERDDISSYTQQYAGNDAARKWLLGNVLRELHQEDIGDQETKDEIGYNGSRQEYLFGIGKPFEIIQYNSVPEIRQAEHNKCTEEPG